MCFLKHIYAAAYLKRYGKYMKQIFALTMLLIASDTLLASGSCNIAIECQNQGRERYDKKEYKQAINYFNQQIDYALAENNTKLTQLGYNNLALSYYKNNELYLALLWTDKALIKDPFDKNAKYNKTLILKKLPKVKWPALNAQYAQHAGSDMLNTLTLHTIDESHVKFEIHKLRFGSGYPVRKYGPAAYGDTEGVSKVTNGNLQYKEGDCEIFITFDKKKLEAIVNFPFYREKKCQFGGQGIYAAGKYKLIKYEKP